MLGYIKLKYSCLKKICLFQRKLKFAPFKEDQAMISVNATNQGERVILTWTLGQGMFLGNANSQNNTLKESVTFSKKCMKSKYNIDILHLYEKGGISKILHRNSYFEKLNIRVLVFMLFNREKVTLLRLSERKKLCNSLCFSPFSFLALFLDGMIFPANFVIGYSGLVQTKLDLLTQHAMRFRATCFRDR